MSTSDPTQPAPRRHDIDALRVLAFAAVMLYHLGMAYVDGWHWHLKSTYETTALQTPMRALNLFRLDLVFLISGAALGLALPRRTTPRLLASRSRRLLLPLAFGMLVVVPYQPYAQALAGGFVEPGLGAFLRRYFSGGPWPAQAFDGAHPGITWNHLWYLAYLWLYTAVLLLLARPLLERPALVSAWSRARGAGLLIAPALPIMLASALLWRRFPPTHDLVHDAWLHAVYGLYFLYGIWLARAAPAWAQLARGRWLALALAGAWLLAHLGLRRDWPLAARLAGDGYAWAMVCALLGFGHRHLNRHWRWLPWAREAVFPWYVLHQTLIIAALAWLGPRRLGGWREPWLVLALTVGGCALLTEGLIRRQAWLRPWFGLPAGRRMESRIRPKSS